MLTRRLDVLLVRLSSLETANGGVLCGMRYGDNSITRRRDSSAAFMRRRLSAVSAFIRAFASSSCARRRSRWAICSA
jgi:hypothetical protein